MSSPLTPSQLDSFLPSPTSLSPIKTSITSPSSSSTLSSIKYRQFTINVIYPGLFRGNRLGISIPTSYKMGSTISQPGQLLFTAIYYTQPTTIDPLTQSSTRVLTTSTPWKNQIKDGFTFWSAVFNGFGERGSINPTIPLQIHVPETDYFASLGGTLENNAEIFAGIEFFVYGTSDISSYFQTQLVSNQILLDVVLPALQLQTISAISSNSQSPPSQPILFSSSSILPTTSTPPAPGTAILWYDSSNSIKLKLNDFIPQSNIEFTIKTYLFSSSSPTPSTVLTTTKITNIDVSSMTATLNLLDLIPSTTLKTSNLFFHIEVVGLTNPQSPTPLQSYISNTFSLQPKCATPPTTGFNDVSNWGTICQNGGVCEDDGICTCTSDWSDDLCETKRIRLISMWSVSIDTSLSPPQPAPITTPINVNSQHVLPTPTTLPLSSDSILWYDQSNTINSVTPQQLDEQDVWVDTYAVFSSKLIKMSSIKINDAINLTAMTVALKITDMIPTTIQKSTIFIHFQFGPRSTLPDVLGSYISNMFAVQPLCMSAPTDVDQFSDLSKWVNVVIMVNVNVQKGT